MTAGPQDEVIAALARPATHGIGGSVERIDTHISAVFLAGDRVVKLKKAVKYPYLDYSTVALRRRYCEAEVRVNRRTAPALYLGAAAISRARDGSLALGAPDATPTGEAVDWVVVMRRFEASALFDRMTREGRLTPALVRDLADEIARFHEAAERDPGFGGADAMARSLANMVGEVAKFAPDLFDRAKAERFAAETGAALERHRASLDARRAQGYVRHGHGDLHLRNICLFEGRPTLFDAIEFDDVLACIDVLYDLAFLLMDLEHRGRRDLANLVLNRTLAWRDDHAGLALLPLYLAMRAGIRAHVTASSVAALGSEDAQEAARGEAHAYLDLALGFLAPAKPVLVAVGGLSGSGKSTVAAALAPTLGAAPGAVVVRSDVIRKRLLGRAPEDRLGPDAYTAEVTRRVYEAVRAQAGAAVAAGCAAIADAVHARPEERRAIEAVAVESGVRFAGLWLEAAPETLASRIGRRENDASDATASVMRAQFGTDTGPIAWRRIDSSGDLAETLTRARNALNGHDETTT